MNEECPLTYSYIGEDKSSRVLQAQRSTMTRSRRSILCEGHGGCWCQWEFSTLVVLLVDGHRLEGGRCEGGQAWRQGGAPFSHSASSQRWWLSTSAAAGLASFVRKRVLFPQDVHDARLSSLVECPPVLPYVCMWY